MNLEAIDQALLAGDMGAASAHAMKLLLSYGRALGADRFISIKSAHIDGVLYHGPSSTDFVRRFVELGGRVRVPTTLNVGATDVVTPDRTPASTRLALVQRELTMLHEELGCIPTLTCAPYQRLFRPGLGDDIAWAESNAIVFANSVLGARTDRYGDFTDLCGAIAGRVPFAGLHRPENRWAKVICEAPEHRLTDLPRDMYFAALGYVLGMRAGARVPAIVGLPGDTSEDELKALGASAASSGAIGMFHAVGITPEARDLDHATGGEASALPCVVLTTQELHGTLDRLCPLETGEAIAAMCLGTPHFSLSEFGRLAEIVAGRKAAQGVGCYVSTSREIAAQVRANPAFAAIGEFGVELVVDTCTYMSPVVRETSGPIVTNSGKWAHYGPGNLGRRAGLMTMERCVRSAEAGKVVGP
ncbi:MAG: aconitase subunit 1 [Bradyrhizobium sp.]|nr:aconitase subunit 1 [Bradyrhizobium sp.]